MCDNCGIVKSVFEGAALMPHENLEPVYSLLSVMLKSERLELYAGDCRFEDMFEVISSEKHFTIRSYLRCSVCGKLYFLGVCVRGAPMYGEADYDEAEIRRTLWGREGELFKW